MIPTEGGVPDVLSGPVDVCVAVSRLAVDRPFTYLLPAGETAGVGSLVSVPFHGRAVNGWVLGPAEEVPDGKLLAVRRVRSAVRFFDEALLALFRWMSERYLAPLATVIERSHPPRVVSEEAVWLAAAAEVGRPGAAAAADGELARRGQPPPNPTPRELSPPPEVIARDASVLARYGEAGRLLGPGAVTWLRPLPDEEAEVCVAAVESCLAAGRQAIVLVPEADPLPATARAVLERFEPRAVAFAGGQARSRYRAWLDVQSGRFDVVVGTRPAVLASLRRLGLVWISREVHPGHREERAPYYHVRDVAAARARLEGAACVLSSISPSVETAEAVRTGMVRVARPSRSLERASAPLVETAPPEGEDRSARLGALLKRARSAALIVSRRGYGVARVCRSCSQPAACATCRGAIVMERGETVCGVCGAAGRCANCGGGDFGVERGGAERVAQWARNVSAGSVVLGPQAGGSPAEDRVFVGTAAEVKDVGPLGLDLVAILDPDRALARAGIHAGERSLATWMEAAAWARPRDRGGRVLVQTRRGGRPAVQALVRWEPVPFLLEEGRRRAEAGFPPGHGVFRVAGGQGLPEALRAAGAGMVVATAAGPARTTEGRRGRSRTASSGRPRASSSATLCLVAVPPDNLPSFRKEILRLIGEGIVERVEAEPQL